jgi:hypothetical protein
LISIICGIVNPSADTVLVNGYDIVRDYRAARSMIGLVPQELTTDAFETVWATVSFSRGLFMTDREFLSALEAATLTSEAFGPIPDPGPICTSTGHCWPRMRSLRTLASTLRERRNWVDRRWSRAILKRQQALKERTITTQGNS